MKKIFVLPVFSLLLLFGCEPTLVAEFQDKAVVESYLHAGNTPQVKISRLIPFRDDVSLSGEDINSLSITITDEDSGNSSTLIAQGEGVYANSAFTIQEGHTYALHLPYNGFSVTASTVIPSKPVDMSLSSSTISVMVRPGIGSLSLSTKATNEPVEVTWANPDNSYYMVVVENIEATPTSIYDWDDDDDRPKPMFRMEPTQASSTQLSQQSFSYLGRHNIILTRMQPEYALLYQSQNNDSQSISEVHANVNNGYGIFTGLNSDTLQIRVVQSSGF
ncbi:MAG: DUF4249 domain-containing protein [Prevotellaceae bacterium]|jgi:hypothetical protein|nr:DUF4249 domain-containing protein [Prevotellaceae bacterium]